MRHRFFLFLSFSLLMIFSCSDGDILTVEFDFEDEFEGCEESELLFYKTKEGPSETLSLLFSNINYAEIFQKSSDSLRFIGDTIIFDEPATFNYRTYNRDNITGSDLFCNIIPPKDLNINIDEEDAVDVTITRILFEDDNDGIRAEFEGPLDGSGEYINPIGDNDGDGIYNFLDDDRDNPAIGDENNQIEQGFDTDGDGLPNFIDEDDDGDNVFTKNENPDPNGDGNPSDAQNTDAELDNNGDNTPDYLDTDDDGDGVPTINEEGDSPDKRPLNDISDNSAGADFLNPNATTSVDATGYRQHSINQEFSIRAVVRNIDIEFLSLDILDFGELSNTNASADSLQIIQTRTATPIFP